MLMKRLNGATFSPLKQSRDPGSVFGTHKTLVLYPSNVTLCSRQASNTEVDVIVRTVQSQRIDHASSTVAAPPSQHGWQIFIQRYLAGSQHVAKLKTKLLRHYTALCEIQKLTN